MLSIFRKCLTFFYKTKHISPPCDPEIPLGNLHKRKKKSSYPQKDLYKTAHSSPIYNSQNWKQVRCWLRGRGLKMLRYVHPTEYYSAIKRNILLIYTQHEWISKSLHWMKKLYTKVYMYYDSNCMKFHNRQNRSMMKINRKTVFS